MLSVSRLSLAAAAVLVMAAPADAQSIGINAALRNEVKLKTASDTALRPAVLREAVHLGDQTTTGPASALQVLLRDKSMFTLGPNARMTFDRFVYDPNRGTSEVAASVAKGAFRFMSGKTQANARKTINTPVGSIGVRGTIVEGVVGPEVLEVLGGQAGLPTLGGDPDALGLIVLRGPSRKTSGFDTPGLIDVTIGGQTITLDHPGQAVLSIGGALYGPFDLSDSAFEQMSFLLRTSPNGPNDGSNFEIESVTVASGDALVDGEAGEATGGDGPFEEDDIFDPGDIDTLDPLDGEVAGEFGGGSGGQGGPGGP